MLSTDFFTVLNNKIENNIMFFTLTGNGTVTYNSGFIFKLRNIKLNQSFPLSNTTEESFESNMEDHYQQYPPLLENNNILEITTFITKKNN